MPRNKINTLLNLGDAQTNRRLQVAIGAMRGLYEVKIEPRRETRSNQQNRYYWGVVVEVMRQFLSDQGEAWTAEQVHEMYKFKFLRRTIIHPTTGEVIGETTGSTAALTTAEFSEYIDKVSAWLSEFGLVVPQASYAEAA